MEKEIDWIRRALKHSGLSQAALMRELNAKYDWPTADRSVINKILQSVRDVSPKELLDISAATDFPLPSEQAKKYRTVVDSFDPDRVEPEHDPDWDGEGAGVVDGSLRFNRRLEGGQPELAAAPGLGNGQFDDRSAHVLSNGIATGHPVVNEWVFPPSYVRNALDAQPTQIVVMPVIGHSMAPILQSNDRVLVDVSQNIWLGDAVYVIDDGDGVFQAKTVKKVLSSNPPRYRIVSEATPEEEPVIRKYDEFRIVGRVVARIARM